MRVGREGQRGKIDEVESSFYIGKEMFQYTKILLTLKQQRQTVIHRSNAQQQAR